MALMAKLDGFAGAEVKVRRAGNGRKERARCGVLPAKVRSFVSSSRGRYGKHDYRSARNGRRLWQNDPAGVVVRVPVEIVASRRLRQRHDVERAVNCDSVLIVRCICVNRYAALPNSSKVWRSSSIQCAPTISSELNERYRGVRLVEDNRSTAAIDGVAAGPSVASVIAVDVNGFPSL